MCEAASNPRVPNCGKSFDMKTHSLIIRIPNLLSYGCSEKDILKIETFLLASPFW